MTNVNGPNGVQGNTYTQTAQVINNNQYFLPVPDSHYQDRVSFEGSAAKPTVTAIIQNGVHSSANDIQVMLGGESYSQLTQSQQLQQTFNTCDQIINALYGANSNARTTIIINQNQQASINQNQQANDPLAELRGMSQMVSAAIRDAQAAMQQQNAAKPEDKKPEVNKEKIEMAAMSLHNAMKGWGTDEEAIMDTLNALTPEEKAHLEMVYAEKYGHGDPAALRDDLKSELSFGEEKEAIRTLNQGSHKNALVAANALHQAMDGCGTDEETVQTVMSNLTADELSEVQDVYQQLYGTSLKEDIEGDFSAFSDGFLPFGFIGYFIDPSSAARNSMLNKLNQADAVKAS